MAAHIDTPARPLGGEASAGSVPTDGLDRGAENAAADRAFSPHSDRTFMEKFLRKLLLALSTWPA